MYSDDLASPARRRLTFLLGGMAALGAAPAWAQRARADVTVLTAYPEQVLSRYEAAFEKACPQYRLRTVWRMPHDALPYLRQPRGKGIDVYWSASPRTFAMLKAEQRWSKLGPDLTGLPGRIGNTDISDPDGYFVATETAAYGFAVNPAYLARHQLAAPADWTDLADARYAGHLAMPSPARVGFAPVMLDIALQAYGWRRGWALWNAIAANATLSGRGASFVSDEVASGRAGIALTIDFFAASAIANGAPLRFIYPRHGGVNPGQVAIADGGPNPAGAQAFVAFLLSEAGQRLLAEPDIRKLPVLPSVYAGLAPDYHNPFAHAQGGGYAYDNARGAPRLALLAAAFEQALARPQPRLVAVWRQLRQAAPDVAAPARALLEAAPVSEDEAAEPALLRAFAERADSAAAQAIAQQAERRWARAADARLAAAEALLGRAS